MKCFGGGGRGGGDHKFRKHVKIVLLDDQEIIQEVQVNDRQLQYYRQLLLIYKVGFRDDNLRLWYVVTDGQKTLMDKLVSPILSEPFVFKGRQEGC